FSLATPNSSGLCRTEIVPSCPTNWNTTPDQVMNNPRVTTNDGIPILDTANPVTQPIAAPTHTARSISSQGFADNPAATSTSASAENAAPAQNRSSTASSAAMARPSTKA